MTASTSFRMNAVMHKEYISAGRGDGLLPTMMITVLMMRKYIRGS